MFSRLSASVAASRNTVPIYLFGFSFGVVCIRFLPSIPPLWSIAMVAFTAIALFCRGQKTVCRLLLVFVIGLCWAAWHAAAIQSAAIPHDLEKRDLTVNGVVAGQVARQEKSTSFDFKVKSLEHNGARIRNPGLIRLTSYEAESNYRAGEHWQFTVRLKRPRSLVNPGMSFDYAAWMMSKGLTAKGYIVRGSERQIPADKALFTLRFDWVEVTRIGFAEFLKTLPIGSSERAVFGALSVGIRDQMDTATWQVLRDTGTAHLVAISGLHIGLVALIAGVFGGAIWGFTGSVRNRITKQDMKWCIAIIAAVTYALLAGLTLPTQRAVTMIIIASLAVFFRKFMPSGWLLSIALAAVLIFNPLAPFASSIWLSFLAVVILVFGLKQDSVNSVTNRNSLIDYLSTGFTVVYKWAVMQGWLFVAMVPVFIAGFQQISLVAPVANLVAVPVIGMIVVPLVLLSLIFWCAGFLDMAAFFIHLSAWLFDAIWSALTWLATLSMATWKSGAPNQVSLFIACLGFVVLILGRGLPYRWLGALWFLPLFISYSPALEHGAFRYTMLDVGQGLASVVETQSHTLVFDTGASYPSGFDLGEAVVVPFIRSQNLSRIDMLLISHGDNDHAGGTRAVSDAFNVSQLFASENNSARLPFKTQLCASGQRWNWDGVQFEMLWPAVAAGTQGNNASCVVRISSAYGSLLLTGDIERAAEQQLVQQDPKKLNVDVLQVPHHGSKTSSTLKFLQSVKPQVALVSSGYLNRFGHPAKTVSERYREENIPMLSIAEQGAIQVHFSPSGVHLIGERIKEPRFWREKPPADGQFPLPQRIAKTHSDILLSG